MNPARYAPTLTGNGERNSALLAELLASAEPGELALPHGRFPLAEGLVVGPGWALCGAGDGVPAVSTWLFADRAGDGEPLLRILGSGVEVRGLGLEPAPSEPGPHGGDRGTAVTVGRYLYPPASPARAPASSDWIERIRLVRLRVRAPSRAANAVAVMGAVRDVTVAGLGVEGGCTGLAVHWGAVGADVSEVAPPTYHPHRLEVADLRVWDAFEGFYLSGVHDVRVAGACLADVDIGFRLLAGDNTARFSDPDVVGRRITVTGACVAWRGNLYGARIAGWGRSEVDGAVTTLTYRDVEVSDCAFTALDGPRGSVRGRSPILLERAYGVRLRGIDVGTDRRAVGPPAACCPLARRG